MTDYRKEVVAALRAEADRIEAGAPLNQVIVSTYDEGYRSGQSSDEYLHHNDDAINGYEDALDPCGGGWDEDSAREHSWGIYVPVRGAAIVHVEPVCGNCEGHFSCTMEFGIVTLRTHEEPAIPEQLGCCEHCEDDE